MGSLLLIYLKEGKITWGFHVMSVVNGTMECLEEMEFPVLGLPQWISKVRN